MLCPLFYIIKEENPKSPLANEIFCDTQRCQFYFQILIDYSVTLQVREVEYQNIIYRVHALHCASNEAFCFGKNKQTKRTTTIMKKNKASEKNVFGIIGERSYTMIRRKFSIPSSSFHQKADNRTCRLPTISKMSFPSAVKKKSDLCENNALTHFSVAHSTYSQTTVKRIGSDLQQVMKKKK